MKFNAKLQTKILFMIGFPLTVLIAAVSFHIADFYETKKEATVMAQNAQVMKATQEVVRTLQNVRAVSTSYVADKATEKELLEVREKSDQAIHVLQGLFKEYSFERTIVESVSHSLEGISSLRKEVDLKKSGAIISGNYSNFIKEISLEASRVAQKDRYEGLEASLVSSGILQDAAEAIGQMRAVGTAVLDSGTAMSQEQEDKLRTLYGMMDAYLDSHALKLSPAAKQEIEKVRSSKELVVVKHGVSIMLQKARVGDYGISRGEYFNAATQTVNGLSAVMEVLLTEVIGQANKDKDTATAQFLSVLLGTVLGVVCLIAFTWIFVRKLSLSMTKIADALANNTNQLNEVAVSVAEASTELSSSATEQASALQETVSSIDEVSAMVAKNADNAKKSQDVSLKGQEAAEDGKKVVESMIQSIEDISRSNADIVLQIEKSNSEIANIVKVITEIGNKTKVINDIVFQTKLLSFNASVEAARAGEHGKGFAVVAEEVGNLAQMSGNAAKEIAEMLENSIHRVESIVTESSHKIEQLVTVGKEKVEAGAVTAKKCGEVLTGIVKDVTDCNVMVSEIAVASQEQNQGVSEITKAMNQLDQVTQQNAAASQQAATSAEQLRGRSAELKLMAEELANLVEGRGVNRGAGKRSDEKQKSPKKGSVIPLKAKAFDSIDESSERGEPSMASMKKVVGGGTPVPTADDDRFEEI